MSREIKLDFTARTDKLTSKLEKDVLATMARLDKAASKLQFSNFGGNTQSKTVSAPRLASYDSEYKKALSDIKQFQVSSLKIESELTRQVEREARQQAQAKTREMKRAADDMIAQIKRVQKEESQAKSTGGFTNFGVALGSFAGNVAAQAVTEVTALVKQGASAWLDYSSKLENTRIGFTTLLGSSQKADKHIRDLQNFAKNTPFDFAGLAKSSQLMQGVGINAERVIPILNDVGNALAAAGKGNEEIDRTVLALTQVYAKGKLAGQEIIQMAENGIPAIQILTQATGKTSAEILKLSEDGQISAELFLSAFQRFSKAKFGDAMKRQSETFSGSMANIKDAVLITSNTAFAPLYKKISALSVETARLIEKQNGSFSDIGQVIGTQIASGLTSAIVTGIGALVEGALQNIVDSFAGKATPFIFKLNEILFEGIAKATNRPNTDLFARNTPNSALARSAMNTAPRVLNYSRPGDYGQNSTNQLLTLPTANKAGTLSDLRVTSGSNYLDSLYLKYAQKENIDPNILLEQGRQETINFRPSVLTGKLASPKGALGAGQFMPKTANRFNVNRYDIEDSIRGQAEYMRWLLNTFNGDYEKALAGYNAGEGAVMKYKGIPPYRETQGYVKTIMGRAGAVSDLKNVQYGTIDPQEIYDQQRQKNIEASNLKTQAQKDSFTDSAIRFFQRAGQVPPDKLIGEMTDYVNRNLELKGNPKVSEQNLQSIFEDLRSKKIGEVSTDSNSVTRTLTLRKTLDEQHVSSLRESLGLEKGINGEATRYEKLAMRERNYAAEVSAILEDQAVSRKESLFNARLEADVLSQRNLSEEAALRYAQDRNNAARELGDLEIELINLRRQNNDAEEVSKRRLLASTREQVDLEKEINNLNDQLANGSVNDSLKIRAALLNDVLDLRNRELDAVIAVNRAQLELSQSMTVSNNQIRAGIYEHIAGANNLNSAYIRGFNKTFDAFNDRLNASLTALDEKTKGYLSFVIEPLKAYQTNALSNVTTKLIDSIFPADIANQFKASGNPLLDESKKQTGYLERLAEAIAPKTPSLLTVAGRGFGGFGNTSSDNNWLSNAPALVAAMAGGNLNNRSGINSPMIMNYGGGSFSNLSLIPDLLGGMSSGVGNGRAANQSALSQLLGKGGIFGEKGFGNNIGTYGAIGSGAGLLGSLVGGRFGGLLSGAGSGLALGAQIGSIVPGIGTAIGAAAGAVIGGAIGLFSNPQRRNDETTRDALMVQTLQRLNEIKSGLDRRPPSIDSNTALLQASQIQANYFSVANSLKDKKTRQIAVKDGNERVTPLVAAISASSRATLQWQVDEENRKKVSSLFTGEFAGGNYFGQDNQLKDMSGLLDMRRGYIAGSKPGVDRHFGMFADDEAIINRKHMNRINSLAGYDLLAEVGIPNYPKAPVLNIPKFAEGFSFAAPVSNTANRTAEPPKIEIGDIVINLNGKRITDAEIESIAINGVKKKFNKLA